MTPFIKKKDIKKDWYIINAQNAVVGRLAAYISKVLRGKNKPTYNPHIDNGDFVVVTNIDKIKFTGKKFTNKKYFRHTGHPGGIKESTPDLMKEKNKIDKVLNVTVDFVAEVITCIKDKNKKIISGNPEKIKKIYDTWVFSRDITSSNPNWLLVNTLT